MSHRPTTAEMLQTITARAIRDLRICTPAKVERYDASLQQIDAQPLIKESYESEEGERISAQLPVICNVPLVFPGLGSYRLTFPVNVGDLVLLVFSASSLDVWLSEGGIVDPRDDRRFSLSDAVAIPGVRSFKTPLAETAQDRMTLGHDAGAQINIDESVVRLNTTTGQLVALSNKVDQAIDTLRTFATTHTHPVPSLGTSLVSAVPLGANTASACSDVYAKE